MTNPNTGHFHTALEMLTALAGARLVETYESELVGTTTLAWFGEDEWIRLEVSKRHPLRAGGGYDLEAEPEPTGAIYYSRFRCDMRNVREARSWAKGWMKREEDRERRAIERMKRELGETAA